MALPLAHTAVALGMTRSRDPLIWICLGLASIVPDFDFILVWGFGLPIEAYHRTFSHSLLFGAAMALLWMVIRPIRLKAISPVLIFAVLLSHSLVDMLCTADALDHGVVFFWPLSDYRMGWPILVPLYLWFGTSPFSVTGALRFTLLEILLAAPLWFLAKSFRSGLMKCVEWLRGEEKSEILTPKSETGLNPGKSSLTPDRAAHKTAATTWQKIRNLNPQIRKFLHAEHKRRVSPGAKRDAAAENS